MTAAPARRYLPHVSAILVATDFSPVADRALAEAIELARALGVRLELVHVHHVRSVAVPPALDLAVVSPSAQQVAEAETALAERTSRVEGQGIPVGSYSAFGDIAAEIIRRADQVAARYIAIGRHGHRPITEALLGSVAERVLRHASCPLLLVPPAHGHS